MNEQPPSFLIGQKRQKTAWMTHLLVFLNGLMMIVLYRAYPSRLSLNTLLYESDPVTLLRLGAQQNSFVLAGEYWRIFTANFLHGGLIHLLFNGYALYYLGTYFEIAFGWKRFVLIYLASGMASGLATLVYIDLDKISVGASGAIFGIAGALFSSIIVLQKLIQGFVHRNVYKSLFVFIVGNALFVFLVDGFNFIRPIGQINSAAHIGGFIAGFTLGYFFIHMTHVQGSRIKAILLVGIVVSLFAGQTWQTLEKPELPLIRAQHAFARGDLLRAKHELNQILSRSDQPLNPNLSCMLGELLFEMKQKTEAIDFLFALTRKIPDHPCAYARLLEIYTYSDLADLSTASEIAETLSQLTPLSPEDFLLLGEHFLRSGNLEQALTFLRRIPGSPGFVEQLIMEANFHLGHYDVVAQARTPQQIESMIFWSLQERAYMALGRIQEAKALQIQIFESYDHLIAQNEDEPGLKNNFAWYLAERGMNLDKAYQLARSIAQQEPKNHYYQDTFGWVLYKQGKLEQALETLSKALELQKSAEYHYHRGVVLEALNDRKNAKMDYLEALKMGLKPDERKDTEIRLKNLAEF